MPHKKLIMFTVIFSLCLTGCETRTDMNSCAVKEYLPRNFYNAKFEPVTRVLHGAGQGRWNTSVDEYRKTLSGKYDPVIINDYITVNISKNQTDAFIKDIRKWLFKFPNYTVIQLGLELGGYEYDDGPFHELSEKVAIGNYDEHLKYLFNALTSLNVPIYIRIGYECNGQWNNYSADSYKRAFRHVASLLRNSSLNNNAAIIWCISADGRSSYMNWYPGDHFVDWWAIDLFSSKKMNSRLTRRFIRDADTHGKPIMIAESSAATTGISGGLDSWDQWFEPYFELIRKNPGIKAFNYINWDWTQFPKQYRGWHDGRIGQNKIIAELYAKEMASPIFLHATTKDDFFDNLKPVLP